MENMPVRILIICGLMIHLLTSGFGIVLACCDRNGSLDIGVQVKLAESCCECCPFIEDTPAQPPAPERSPDQEDAGCCGTWCPGETKRFVDEFDAMLREGVGHDVPLFKLAIAHPTITGTRSLGFVPRIEHERPRYESAPAWCAQVCIWLQ